MTVGTLWEIGAASRKLTSKRGAVSGASAGTSYPILYPSDATFPDASGSGNSPATLETIVSSGTQTANTPKVTYVQALFDPGTDEHLMWTFPLPSSFSSAITLTLYWGAKVTTGNVVWKASVMVATASSTDLDAAVFQTPVTAAATTVPSTSEQYKTTTITLSPTGGAAGKWVTVMVGRDADNGDDTAAGDATLLCVDPNTATAGASCLAPTWQSVDHDGFGSGTPGTSVVVSPPPGVASGDLVVVSLGWSGDPGTVTSPGGWTIVEATGSTMHLHTFYKLYAGEADWTWSWVTSRGVQVVKHRITSATSINTAASTEASGTSTTATGTAITVGTSPSLLMMVVGSDVQQDSLSDGFTTPSGMTERWDASNSFGPSLAVFTQEVSTGSTGSRVSTLDTSSNWTVHMFEVENDC